MDSNQKPGSRLGAASVTACPRSHLGIAVGLVAALAATAVNADEIPVNWMPPSGMDAGPVEGASAKILSTPEGLSMQIASKGLEPGHVVTAWWIVLQNPGECDPRPCTPKDGIGRWQEVDNAITHAAGSVVAPDGSINLSSYLPVGPVAGNWFATQITKPETAEIHIILNDHGPLIPNMAAAMLNSYRAGCTDESIPAIFPNTAKADGAPGPNKCRLVQVAIQVQD